MTLSLLVLLAGCRGDILLPGEGDFGDSGMFCDEKSEAPLETGFADTLEPEGCRYTLTAANADGTIELVLDVPAFADAAAGVPASATYTLPDDVVRFEVNVGCALGEGVCEDGASGIGFLTRTYTASAGTVAVEATPDGEEADAVVTFTDVTLTDEYEESVVLDATFDVRLYASVE